MTMPQKTNAPMVARPVAVADLIERLAFAACGAKLWPSPYAADYHRGAVRRMLDALTEKDVRLIEAMKR